MAGALLGRHKTPCVSCGFEHVHIKSNEGKHPYLYCPTCGLTTPSRNGLQAAGLMAGLRPEKHTGAPQLMAGNPPQLERRPDDIVIDAAPPADPPAAPEPKPATQAKPASSWATIIGQIPK